MLLRGQLAWALRAVVLVMLIAHCGGDTGGGPEAICGNGILDGGPEECDGDDDGLCEGRCDVDCRCKDFPPPGQCRQEGETCRHDASECCPPNLVCGTGVCVRVAAVATSTPSPGAVTATPTAIPNPTVAATPAGAGRQDVVGGFVSTPPVTAFAVVRSLAE